jgi:Na+/H+ antiporter NhaD/arsenite permease-like protein
MSWHAWATLIVIVTVFTLLMITRRPPDAILVAGVSLLTVLGVLTPSQAISGLSNEGVVTIAVLFAVAAGLKATGAMSWLGHYLLGRPKSLVAAQWRVMFPVATLSAFMNNTPLVAILLPVVHDWSRQKQFPISKLLIPLSYASILGGACTLVGTSTNLIINGWLIEEMNHPGLGMFELAYRVLYVA